MRKFSVWMKSTLARPACGRLLLKVEESVGKANCERHDTENE
jgi:hypothetical protein